MVVCVSNHYARGYDELIVLRVGFGNASPEAAHWCRGSVPGGHGGVTAWCPSSASPSSAHAAAMLPRRVAHARACRAAPARWSLAMPAVRRSQR